MYIAMIALAAAAALPTGAAPRDATAKSTGPAVVASANDAARPAEPRYCVSRVPTGSILKQKTCRSRAEWLALGFDPLAKE